MLPAGTYYVGDLCYVLDCEDDDVWAEICENHFSGYEEAALKDGRRFAIFPTLHGDGMYPTDTGKECGVDSGTIGCVLISDLKAEGRDFVNRRGDLCAVMTFDSPFEVRSDEDGKIWFGDRWVDTGNNPDDEEDEWGSDYDPCTCEACTGYSDLDDEGSMDQN